MNASPERRQAMRFPRWGTFEAYGHALQISTLSALKGNHLFVERVTEA
jgi:hypothetical protein